MPNPSSSTPQRQAARQVVQVVFDREFLRLVLRPSSVTVQAGDVLVWQFDGLPKDFFPWIYFTPDAASGRSWPPVDSLTQSSGGLWGTVAASAGCYRYRATIQTCFGSEHDDEPASFYSAPAEVRVEEAASGKRAVDRVYTVEVSKDGSDLTVQPDTVRMHGDDQVVWTFRPEILQDSGGPLRARIQFVRGPGGDFQLGPFTAMTHRAEDDGGATVTGTGYAANGIGRYSYRVLAFREQSGEIVWASSPDPTIDDEGPPP